MKRYIPYILGFFALLAIGYIAYRMATLNSRDGKEASSKTVIPEDLPTEFGGPTRIRLRQIERADSMGMFIIANHLGVGEWVDSVRYVNGKLVVNGDTVNVRDDGIICTGSYSDMMQHVPPPSDSCQMFLIDSTNLLFNFDPVDSIWTSVYHDMLIVRENSHGRTHAPGKGAYFDENTGHFELAVGDTLPTHVFLSMEGGDESLDYYVVASAGRYPKRLFLDWPTLADDQYYFHRDTSVAGFITTDARKDSIRLFRQVDGWIEVNVDRRSGVHSSGSGASVSVDSPDDVPANASIGETYKVGEYEKIMKVDSVNNTGYTPDGEIVRELVSGEKYLITKGGGVNETEFRMEWFGAVPSDNITDSVALDKALDFVQPGSTLFFGDGTYHVGVSHDIEKAGLKLMGVRGKTEFMVDSVFNSIQPILQVADGNKDLFIDGIHFRSLLLADTTGGNNPRTSNVRAINAVGHIEGMVVQYCRFTELENTMRTNGGKNNKFIHNTVINCRQGGLFQRDTNILVAFNYFEHSQTPYRAESGKFHLNYFNTCVGASVIYNVYTGQGSAGRSINVQAETETDSVDQFKIVGNRLINTNGVNFPVNAKGLVFALNTITKDSLCIDCGDGKMLHTTASSADVIVSNNFWTNNTATEISPISWPDTANLNVVGGFFKGIFEFGVNDDLNLKFTTTHFIVKPNANTYPFRKSRPGDLEINGCYITYLGNPETPAVRVDHADAFVRVFNTRIDNNHGTDPYAMEVISGKLLVEDCIFDGFTRVVSSSDDASNFRVWNAKDEVGNMMPDNRVSVSVNYTTRGEEVILINDDITLTVSSDDIVYSTYKARIINRSDLAATIDPEASRTIDGATTYTLPGKSSIYVQSDGSNLYTVGYGGAHSPSVYSSVESSVSIDASGDATITHGLGYTPNVVFVQNTTATNYTTEVSNITSTTFDVKFRLADSNTTSAATVSFFWMSIK